MAGRVICLWSGPRNVSTALMYSFAQLDDIDVVDEPLYAHYLRGSGRDHPGRDDVLASQEADGERGLLDLRLRADTGRRQHARPGGHDQEKNGGGKGEHAATVGILRLRSIREHGGNRHGFRAFSGSEHGSA